MAVRKTKTTKQSGTKPKRATKKRQGDLIFSLDIGTRTVVGIVGKMVNDVFQVIDFERLPHPKRAMIDGQIEDIEEVAKVVKKVKDTLEKRLNVSFSHVAIAAAGRALKTMRECIEIDVVTTDYISEELAKSYEIEAVSSAKKKIDKESLEDDVQFYCVGFSVVEYKLDNYSIKSITGHKGKKVSIEIIAAFLPSLVVESLYSVMEKNHLTVSSLTLEPIAAMNVIIPPEVRLINIALVDIGAGTSDIAVSKNGSIIAYAMATTAGDEITEEIIKQYLVDFDTAEEMKLNSSQDDITFTDILGFEHTITSKEFYSTIFTSVEVLAETISQNVIDINKEAPAAIFLVGGGSLVTDLPKLLAKKLNIPETRVAVGGSNFIKTVAIVDKTLTSPEYVTPIGIGVTSVLEKGYDFSTVFLNDKKFRVFDTKNLTVFDVLLMGGYKAKDILGRSGKGLSFTLNGEVITYKGAVSSPAEITLNQEPTTINSPVNQWDKIVFIPATNGASAEISLSDVAGDVSRKSVVFNDASYFFGGTATINGENITGEYIIQNGDDIQISSISTLEQLLNTIEFSEENVIFLQGKNVIQKNYLLQDGDVIFTIANPVAVTPAEPELPKEEVNEVIEEIEEHEEEIILDVEEIVAQEVIAEPQKPPVTPEMQIYLNGKAVMLPAREDNEQHDFLEVLTLLDFDRNNLSGSLIMTINGNEAFYTSKLKENDNIIMRFN